MIAENYLKYKITEKNSNLYRILCVLEDNYKPYNTIIGEEGVGDSLVIDPSIYIELYKDIRGYIGDDIEVLYRNRINSDKRPTPEIDSNNYLRMYGNYWVNPISGYWRNEKEGKKGEFSEALSIYAKRVIRGKSIELSKSIREIINYGLLNPSIIKQIVKNKMVKKYYSEIKYSIFKFRLTGENKKEEFEEFLSRPEYPRCIPWKDEEKNEYGFWIWPDRYFRDKLVNYPQNNEIELIDADTSKVGRISRKRITNNVFVIEAEKMDGIYFLNYSNMFLNLINNYKGISDYFGCSRLQGGYTNLLKNITITYKNYQLSYNNQNKANIEYFLAAVRDFGYIPIKKEERFVFSEEWDQIIEMPK